MFFGRTTSIPIETVDYINALDETNRIKLTAHDGEFTHFGFNADISLIDYSSLYIEILV